MKLKLPILAFASVLLLTGVGPSYAGSITNLIDVQYFGSTNSPDGTPGQGTGTNYSGAAILGSAGDTWNPEQIGYYFRSPSPFFNNVPLVNSANVASGLTLSLAYYGGNPIQGQEWTGTPTDPATTNLMASSIYIFSVSGAGNPNFTTTHTIGGLSGFAGDTANLVVYAGAPSAQTEQIALTNGATGGNSSSNLTTTSASRMLSAGAGVAYVEFTNVTLTGGNLVFTVGNSTAPNYSNAGYVNGFQLQILVPDPSISSQPASQNVTPGQTAKFSVSALGASAFTYQWQATNNVNGFTNLVNGGQISGAGTNVLSISNVTSNNALQYRVIATDSSGSVTSSVASLTVSSSELIDVDIGVGAVQTGPAVLGIGNNDVWNAVTATGNTAPLVDAGDNTLTGVGFSLTAQGAGAVDTGGTPMDLGTTPLMEDYAYQSSATPITASLTGLTNYIGYPFTLVVYAAGDTASPSQGGTIDITTGATGLNTNNVATTAASRQISAGNGVCYQTFTGVLTNGTLTFTVTRLAGTTYVGLNGLQLQIQVPNPAITTSPVSQTALTGSTAQFSVVAGGNTPFGYQWQAGTVGSGGPYTNVLNTGGITGATSNILTLPNLTTSETLDYVVVVTNAYGSITSAPATLTVLAIPDITNQPVSISRFIGQGASFSVGAEGTGTLGYQWQATNDVNGFTNLVNGGQISGAKSSALYITSVTTNNALVYQVIVTNANGGVTSAPVTLTVNAGNSLIDVDFDSTNGLGALQTQSGAAVLGSPGDLWNSEVASGAVFTGSNLTNSSGVSTPIEVQLFSPGANGNEFFTNTTADPGTTNLMVDDAYSPGYVNMQLSGLTPNLQFTLVIYGAGATTNAGDSITLYPGNDATFTSATALTISGASQSIAAGAGVAYNTYTGIVGPSGLLIFQVAAGAGGDGNSHLNGLQLKLVAPADPSITSEPVSQTNFPGTNVSFSVTATGTAPLSYQWQSGPLAGPYTNLVNNAVFSGVTSNILSLTSITTNQALAYRVIVSDFNGSVTSAPPATLTVLTLPLITSEPASQGTLLGQTVSFNVGVSGVSPFTYQWQATNGVSGYTNIINGGPVFSGATSNVLTIAGVTTNQLRAYRVIVSNSSGSVTSTPAYLTLDSSTRLIDVDIGSATIVQTGAAVLGTAGDAWNGVAAANTTTIVDSSSNTMSGVQLLIANGNQFYNSILGTAMDPGTTNLMEDYAFGYNNPNFTAKIVVSLTNLTEYINSPFELIIYAAGNNTGQGATLTLTGAAGGNSTNTLVTSAASRQLSAGPGAAYAVYTGTLTNGTLTFTASENAGQPFTAVNGFQLLLSPNLPPVIATNPASALASVNGTTSFSVGVVGTAPLSYQWQATNSAAGGYTNLVNNGQISGAKTNVLTISNVTTNNALTYQVIVTNSYGSVTSSPAATLTIAPGPSLVGEWFTNSNAGDQGYADLSGFQPAGTHDGYVAGASQPNWAFGDAPAGYAGDSLAFDGGEGMAISNTVSSDAGYEPTFDSYLTNAMTVSFWAKNLVITNQTPFVSKNGVSAGWQFQSLTATNPTYSLIGTGSGTNDLVASTNVIDGNWHFYAGTWNGTTGIRSLYVDGVLLTNLTNDFAPMTAAGTYRLVLAGQDTGSIGSFLSGQLFDVRVYNYPLTPAQITGLYLNQPATVSTNAYLTSLVLSPAGTLSPAFASNGFSYAATNAYNSNPTVTVVNSDLTATNRLIYNSVTNLLGSGVASSPLSLTLGVTNVVKVQVTAQDGVTKQTYTVSVIELPNLATKPVMTNSVSGSTLNLNWGSQYLGYRLLVQTNNLNKGVSANSNDWATVAGSTATTSTNLTLLKTNLNEYYKLVYP
jgi:hypothetical protein